MSDTEVVHSSLEGGVLTLTLDSPKNRNALGAALVTQLQAGLTRAREDTEVRAVVLTHAGGTFCAGADLSEALSRGASVEEATAEGTQAMIGLMRGIVELPKPVIGLVDGHVRAGGFGLLGATDIALGGPQSTFALTEVRLGLAPSMISLVLTPKMTSRAASRYFLTGEKFDARKAVEIGLLTESADSREALDAVLAAVVTGLRKASPQGLAAAKALTTGAVIAAIDANAERLAAESAGLFVSDEAREGMTAFLSKRKPNWDLTEQ